MSQDPSTFPLPFLVRDHLRFEGAAVFDLLVVTAADVARSVEVSGMTREGPFIFTFITGTGSSAESRTFRIPDVPVSLTVRLVSLTAGVNEVYALVYMRVNETRTVLLGQGNLGHGYGISWPTQPPMTPLQLRGKMTSVTSADPAAGAELTQTVPSGQFWILRGLHFSLVTDATVANRRVQLVITPPGSGVVNLRISSPAVQVASTTVRYHFYVGAASLENATSLVQHSPLPAGMLLPNDTEIASLTTNLQAGDNLSTMELYYEMFYSAR